MSLMAVPVDGALAVVAKLASSDEASASVLLEFALYEALCDEADRVRPQLERDANAYLAKRLEGGLQQLAKRYAGTDDLEVRAQAVALADEMAQMAQGLVAKDDTDGWNEKEHPRGAGGRFRRGVLNVLGLATKEPGAGDRANRALSQMVGDKANNYTRLSALGGALTATRDPQASAAGTMARLAGEIGPEAQRALEPGLRRTAYRYRGTERRPNADQQRQALVLAATASPEDLAAMPPELQAQAVQLQVELGNVKRAEGVRTQAGRTQRTPGIPTMSPAVGALYANPATARASEDQTRLARTGDYSALLLRDQVPDIDTARLSLEAGKMPPSLGIMSDANGKMVSEAMGFNGDHYLPFDLKNLKRLNGGSYTRTRTSGGLTDEDIYTGLMTGARQVQVISNSGSFTIEFDPDLRGGRRHSDKARQMVSRYSALVARVATGQHMQVDVSSEVMRGIRSEALTRYPGQPEEAKAYIAREQDIKRMEARFQDVDEDKLMAEADTEAIKERGASNLSGAAFNQRRNELFRDKRTAAYDGMARSFKLDGDGYTAAMKALQTEFPYFIRSVRTSPLHEFLTGRGALRPGEALPRAGGSDQGYTPRGGLDPSGVPKDKRKSYARPTSGDMVPAADAPAAGGANLQRTAGGAQRLAASGGLLGALLEPDAPSFEELAAKGTIRFKRDTAIMLGTTLGLRDAIGGDSMRPKEEGKDNKAGINNDLAPFDIDMKPIGRNDGEALKLSAAAYGDWALTKQVFANNTEFVNFLADPKTPEEHLVKTREALLWLQAQQPDDAQLASQFASANWTGMISRLAALRGATSGLFAPAGDNPALALPDPDDPKPQPMPDVVALKGSLANIKAYAQRNPQVAEQAARLAKEPDLNKTAGAQITTKVERLESLISWGNGGAKPLAMAAGDKAEAVRVAADPANSPQARELGHLQNAWALVAAANLVAMLDANGAGVEPLDFSAIAPKAPGVPPAPVTPTMPITKPITKQWGPAPSRVQLSRVGRDSAVAKALAARAFR